MNSALARLIGQAEVRLADAGRRAVENVTTPLREKGQEIAAETLQAVTATARTIAIKAVLGLVAAIMATVALVYALGALYAALLPHLGPVEASLAIAGLFALLAIVAVVAILVWPSGKPVKAAAVKVKADARAAVEQTRAAAAETVTAARTPPDAPAPSSPKAGFEALLSVLGDAGFRREQAGLRAGLALASQLSPIQIVSLALIGGFVTGLRFPARR